jgi:hypothetical protein
MPNPAHRRPALAARSQLLSRYIHSYFASILEGYPLRQFADPRAISTLQETINYNNNNNNAKSYG